MLDPISQSGERLVAYCVEQGIELIRTRSVKGGEFVDWVVAMEPDIIVSTHFQQILPGRLFNCVRLGAFNLHPSLLPMYRGMSPQHWPIVFGDTETGVTVHRMVEEVDAGRIMRQVRIPLERDLYIHELQKKFLAVYGEIMVESVRLAAEGFPGVDQPSGGGSYFHKIRDKDMQITLGMPVLRAYCMIRAFSLPYSGAWFDDLCLVRADPLSNAEYEALLLEGATRGLYRYHKRLFLVLQDGALEVSKWKKK